MVKEGKETIPEAVKLLALINLGKDTEFLKGFECVPGCVCVCIFGLLFSLPSP